MLAPRNLPAHFAAWNRAHRAPFGPRWWRTLVRLHLRRPGVLWRRRMHLPAWAMRRIGPFGFQKNSPARAFEYPWCFFATPLARGMRVVDLGAGASGFQFVLADRGLDVTMVDPLVEPGAARGDWRFGAEEFAHLNEAFDGRVTPFLDHLRKADLPADSVDRVFCISVLEHVPEDTARALGTEVQRILRPGGCLVSTIDLFLDCQPFAPARSIRIGANVSVKGLTEDAGLRLNAGRREELFGFAEFDPSRILRRLDDFLVVNRVLTQCLVAQKPVAETPKTKVQCVPKRGKAG